MAKKCRGCGREFGGLDGDLCFLCLEIVPVREQGWYGTQKTDGPDTDWHEDPFDDPAFVDGDGEKF
jgi:hypothetical protein